MPSEIELLRSLDDEPRTPSTVDVQRAIATGRRRRARRAAGYTGAAAITVLAVAGASVVAAGVVRDAPPQAGATGAPPTTSTTIETLATPPTSCVLERLPAPDGAPMALVSGADPTGKYLVGRSYPRPGGYQAVIWHDGKATKVMLPGDVEESLRDVNSTGTAVGWSYTSGADGTYSVPYAYHGGKVSKLPGVTRGSASAINDAGAIVGDDDEGHALRWPSVTAQPTRLPVPAGVSGAMAADIDEDGTVVGNLDHQLPYVWLPDGTHRQLPMPTLHGEPAATATATSIRNGWVTGTATNGLGRKGDAAKDPSGAEAAKVVAVRWNVRTGEVRVFDGLKMGANATNAHGWQVGTDKQGRAVLVADDQAVVLPALDVRTPDGLSNIPNTVSDDGRTIGGQSDDHSDTIQAVVWRCR
ncbi:hypothetical protein GCM10022251_38570 [Phytohabitans flavus]|uniref:Uncharacterized protein n=1 Tax=Phytohabitans flavus TaxID=1076124 RepID=A0A6F8XVH7_9ACTN|nr:hypothetical protein [Phytohabitans flavus]BCB77820.1 hypothetical protein Pflav_042300 [Phytohabitans flavus]